MLSELFAEYFVAVIVLWGITAYLISLQCSALVLIVVVFLVLSPKIRNTRKEWSAIEPLLDFDWAVTEPYQLRPFRPKFFLTMGLETTSLSNLINIDREFFHRLALRREILRDHGECVAATEAVQPAVSELYHFLVKIYLPRRFPTVFTVLTPERCLMNKVSGESYPLVCLPTATATLKTLGTLVDEDFMILLPDGDGNGYSLQGYVACFSSGFDFNNLLGSKLHDLHAKVPGYQDKLQLSMGRWFDRLTPGTFVRRANWTITTHGRLRNSCGENQVYETQSGARREFNISETHLRVELQQIHRLPQTHAIVFCYKTYLYPLSEIKSEGSGEALATAIEGLKKGNVPEVAQYKGSDIWGQQVIDYLRD